MSDIFVKPLRSNERNNINKLLERELQDITLIKSLDGEMLTEYRGNHTSYSNLDFPLFYKDVLSKLYTKTYNEWDSGVYAFWHSNTDVNIKAISYQQYLTQELFEIIRLCNVEKDPFTQELFSAVLDFFCKSQREITEFHLLHGDLYLGNILAFNNSYKLIDFEYVRRGPKNLELAFVMFWDIISEDNFCFRKKRTDKVTKNLLSLLTEGIISHCDLFEIFDLFIPTVLLCAFSFAYKGDYENGSSLILQGATTFWNEEYQTIRQGVLNE